MRFPFLFNGNESAMRFLLSGGLAPACKGGSGATRILRSKRPSVSGPWNAGCGGVGLGGEKRESCFIGKNRVVFWYGNCFISYSGYFGRY